MKTDEQLYLAARQGESRAYDELYRRFERPLFGFILRRVGCRQDAEDLFQEAMLAVLKGAVLDLHRGAFAGWLYTVASNLSANRLRSRRRAALGQAAAEPPPLPASAETQALAGEQRRHLAVAAARLSPRQAEVLRLRLEGHSNEAIAARLGVPLGTVKSRVYLVVERLRKEMAKWAAP